MSRIAWTETELQQLSRLRAEGLSRHELAPHFPHRSDGSLKNAITRLSRPRAAQRMSWTPEAVERLGRLFNQGESSRKIARALGCSRAAVERQVWLRGFRRERLNDETERLLRVLRRHNDPIPWRRFLGHVRNPKRAHSALQTLVRKGIVVAVRMSRTEKAYVLAEAHR